MISCQAEQLDIRSTVLVRRRCTLQKSRFKALQPADEHLVLL